MRFALVALVTLSLLGCSPESQQRSPVAPDRVQAPTATPRPVTSAGIWVMAFTPTLICIENATLEAVGGQAIGQKWTQETPCSPWDFGGGFFLYDLTPDVNLIARITAPGFGTKDITLHPTQGPRFSTGPPVIVELSKIQ